MSGNLNSKYISVKIENGILICDIKTMDEMDLETAKICADQRIGVCNGASYPTIFDISRVKGSDREARNYLAGEKGSEGVIASALIVNSPTKKMIGNYFIIVHKPLVPTRLFTDRSSAMKWLEQFKEDENHQKHGT